MIRIPAIRNTLGNSGEPRRGGRRAELQSGNGEFMPIRRSVVAVAAAISVVMFLFLPVQGQTQTTGQLQDRVAALERQLAALQAQMAEFEPSLATERAERVAGDLRLEQSLDAETVARVEADEAAGPVEAYSAKDAFGRVSGDTEAFAATTLRGLPAGVYTVSGNVDFTFEEPCILCIEFYFVQCGFLASDGSSSFSAPVSFPDSRSTVAVVGSIVIGTSNADLTLTCTNFGRPIENGNAEIVATKVNTLHRQ